MNTSLQIQEAKNVTLFPSQAEWEMLKEQAAMVVKTGFLPSAIRTPEQAIAIALKGRELGIPPMQSFAHIYIIQGKPTISSELMLSLIFKNCPGAIMNYVQSTNDSCVIEAKRPNGSAARFSFTMDDARRADLLGKGNWKNYPGAMLRARAIAIMARALFPDAIMGCSYTPEELGAEINSDGEVVTLPVVIPEQPGPEDGDGKQHDGYVIPGHLGWELAQKHPQDCDPVVLREKILEIEAKYAGKPMPAGAKKFIEECEPVVAAWENGGPDAA